MNQAWLTGALVLVTILHAVALFAAIRVRRTRRSAGGAPGDGDVGLACPDCGAVNEPRYRFCRSCIAELPGTGRGGADGGAAAGRRTL